MTARRERPGVGSIPDVTAASMPPELRDLSTLHFMVDEPQRALLGRTAVESATRCRPQ